MVYDKDFDVALGGVQVLIAETNQRVTTSENGDYVFGDVAPGTYTLVFGKEGYARQVRTDVAVQPGQLAEVNVELTGEFVEMEEVRVQEVELEVGTQQEELDIRQSAEGVVDAISADSISQRGLSDAAAAVGAVAGATVQDGKYAVVRGLPDRYVNSQMNSVRLPTADIDKRAVELDQYPAAVIQTIKVTKSFTPDQQGDASGGAVNVILKGIPEAAVAKFSMGRGWNTQDPSDGEFLSWKGSHVPKYGDLHRPVPTDLSSIRRDIVGVSYGDLPADYDWSFAAGGKLPLECGITLGAFGNFYYKRSRSYYANGIDDSKWIDPLAAWVDDPTRTMVPKTEQGDTAVGQPFYTSLMDITRGEESVQWGALMTFGIESENNSLNLVYNYTRDATSKATLAEDTRGKLYYNDQVLKSGIPYDPYDPDHPANEDGADIFSAPWLRRETLEYTERATDTLQLTGRHTFAFFERMGLQRSADNSAVFVVLPPELDWTVARSTATMDQPDKRLFGAYWTPQTTNLIFVPFPPPPQFVDFGFPPTWHQLKPGQNVNLGHVQRLWKSIEETSDQLLLNLKFPFEQWDGREGYVKFGWFHDVVEREYLQDSFQSPPPAGFEELPDADWTVFWSELYPDENNPYSASTYDVDYDGGQEIDAWYYMVDLPVTSFLNIIGGARFERTRLETTNYADANATWITPGGNIAAFSDAANVNFEQEDILPSIGFVLTPWRDPETKADLITVRGSYTETVARQTFKELTPIQQFEYLGAPIFVGNPSLGMASLQNYDVRFDFTPMPGSLFSVSYFRKNMRNPIEYDQRVAGFTKYTTAANYPSGKLSGYEFEVRQDLGELWEPLDGLSFGANATVMESVVNLPQTEIDKLAGIALPLDITSRDMSQTPAYLYNLNLTYDIEELGTQFTVFYSVKGDTLLVGPGRDGNRFVPSIYATERATLNASVSQKLFGDCIKLKFAAKNLTNPEIQEVYRADILPRDEIRRSYKKGIDYSISLSAQWDF